MTLVNQMIREPEALADACITGDSLERIVRGSIFAIVVGTALFGAVLGGTRGGLQVAYSAVKLPMALLGTLVVATPAFHAFAALAGKPMPLRSGSALVLAALARSSLALLALSPLLWLVVDIGFGYHACIELAVLLYGCAGLAAAAVIARGLAGAPHRAAATLGFLCVFLPVFAQTAWVLRPYAGRPSQSDVPFLREPEGDFMSAIGGSSRSMLGIYDNRDHEGYDYRVQRETREAYERELEAAEAHPEIPSPDYAPEAPMSAPYAPIEHGEEPATPTPSDEERVR